MGTRAFMPSQQIYMKSRAVLIFIQGLLHQEQPRIPQGKVRAPSCSMELSGLRGFSPLPWEPSAPAVSPKLFGPNRPILGGKSLPQCN